MLFIKEQAFKLNGFTYYVSIMFCTNKRVFRAKMTPNLAGTGNLDDLASDTYNGICSLILNRITQMFPSKDHIKLYIHYRFYANYNVPNKRILRKEELFRYHIDRCAAFGLTWDIYESADEVNYFKDNKRYSHSDLRGKFIPWSIQLEEKFVDLQRKLTEIVMLTQYVDNMDQETLIQFLMNNNHKTLF